MAREQCRLPIRRCIIISICVLMILTGLGCSSESDEATSDGDGSHRSTQIGLVIPRQAEGQAVSEIVCVVVRVTAPDLDQPRGAAVVIPRGAASIELAIDVPVGADRQFEAEAFAEEAACDVAAIAPSFVPNFIPLLQNDGVVTADITPSGTAVLIPMVPVTGLVVRLPAPPSDRDGETVSLQLVVRDPSGAPLEFSATGLPLDLSIDTATGLIAGTLRRGASVNSPYSVTVTVSNGTNLARSSFLWTVINPVPVVTSPGNQAAAEGATIALQIEASDLDRDPLVFSATGLPPDLSINPATGLISGTISATASAGSPYAVTVVASDGAESGRIAFTWDVASAVPMILIADRTMVENDRAGAVFTVSLSAATGRMVTVDFATADDSARAGLDYEASSGTLTFAPGVTTQMLTIPILNDTLDEPSETFFVNLSNPSNGTIADEQGVGTIQDDDAPPTLSINDAMVTEGNGGTAAAVFTVTLSAPSSLQIAVRYDTANGTAMAEADYQTVGATLSFAAGETMQTLTVPVIGDEDLEDDETFVVRLSSATNATIADGTGMGTIINDDTLPRLSINDVSVPEDSLSAMFTLTLSATRPEMVTVEYAVSGVTATDNVDFQVRTGRITFPPNTMTQPLTILVFGDGDIETDETFLVTLSDAVNAIIADDEGVGTILNDDSNVIVASEHTDELLRYDGATGAFRDVFVADDPTTPDEDESGGLQAPGDLLLGRDDRLYVTSQATGEILSYDAETGTFLGILIGDDPTTPNVDESGGLQAPGSLLLGPGNRLYVASQLTDEIRRYEVQTGQFIDTFVTDDPSTLDVDESGGLQGVTGLVLSPAGQLYVSSFHTNQILRYDVHTGVFLGAVVADNPSTSDDESGGLKGPSGLVVGPDGHLYVSSSDTHEVLRYDGGTGVLIDRFITATKGGLESPGQLAFGPDGQFYVFQAHTGQVLHYEGRTGAFLGVYMTSGVEPGGSAHSTRFMFRHQVHDDH